MTSYLSTFEMRIPSWKEFSSVTEIIYVYIIYITIYICIYNMLFYIGHCATYSKVTSGNSVSYELFLVETCI